MPGRETATVEAWLRRHPSFEAGCRDGSTTYAEAVRRALPDALRISDRRQLWHNLVEAVRKEVGAQHLLGESGSHLLQEIREPGCTGSSNVLAHYIVQGRVKADRPALRPGAPPRYLLTHPERLKDHRRDHIEAARTTCKEMNALADLVHHFAVLLDPADGNAALLSTWITLSQAEDLPHLRVFTRGLKAGFAPAVAREASHAFGAARRPLSSVAR
ncbi:transposase [Streptomyces spinosus]|uniref:transposase n=1 Tax=Streptomyces spinosus TaxID=2872623 RepID=UPI001CED75F8|nr:transposase [Streptomyces spinosus]